LIWISDIYTQSVEKNNKYNSTYSAVKDLTNCYSRSYYKRPITAALLTIS